MSKPVLLPQDAALSLALAIVASSTAPLVLLDGEMIVLGASTSFHRDFHVDAGGVTGASLFALGAGEWDTPKLRSLLRATVSANAEIEAYEMDLDTPRGRRRLVLNAHKLAYDDGDQERILLSVADVTDARLAEKLKEDLLRDKSVLLQEIQHRVANSLQIIASVIMQSAKRVQSEETRTHLKDAHLRVMSVAQLQRQLAQSQIGDVDIRKYLDDLCKSIGASMIRDHNQISLAVNADDSVTTADVSVSLGLIVTELVINSLKHAFPDFRAGKIVVSYQARGSDWNLSVGDDGVGMPPASDNAKSGLGTSIITALANQLDAKIEVAAGNPGTLVSIIHDSTDAATNPAPA
jgi:two-component system, sensor histidine kinase PdtaS